MGNGPVSICRRWTLSKLIGAMLEFGFELEAAERNAPLLLPLFNDPRGIEAALIEFEPILAADLGLLKLKLAAEENQALKIGIGERGVHYEGSRAQLIAAGLMHGRAFPGDPGVRPRKVRFPDGVVCGRALRGRKSAALRFWVHVPHELVHQVLGADSAFRRFLERVRATDA